MDKYIRTAVSQDLTIIDSISKTLNNKDTLDFLEILYNWSVSFKNDKVVCHVLHLHNNPTQKMLRDFIIYYQHDENMLKICSSYFNNCVINELPKDDISLYDRLQIFGYTIELSCTCLVKKYPLILQQRYPITGEIVTEILNTNALFNHDMKPVMARADKEVVNNVLIKIFTINNKSELVKLYNKFNCSPLLDTFIEHIPELNYEYVDGLYAWRIIEHQKAYQKYLISITEHSIKRLLNDHLITIEYVGSSIIRNCIEGMLYDSINGHITKYFNLNKNATTDKMDCRKHSIPTPSISYCTNGSLKCTISYISAGTYYGEELDVIITVNMDVLTHIIRMLQSLKTINNISEFFSYENDRMKNSRRYWYSEYEYFGNENLFIIIKLAKYIITKCTKIDKGICCVLDNFIKETNYINVPQDRYY